MKIYSFVLLALFLLSTALCHTYVQVGVNSNFLIDEGKVYFAQSDGTLAVLNLATGEVIARKKNIYYSDTLKIVENGLFVFTYSQLTMLNKNTLKVIWQTNVSHRPIIRDNILVSYDGNGLVECRELTTGKVLWSYNLEGALYYEIKNGKVLVFREAVYEGPNVKPAVVLLDLSTGKELLHRTTPPNVHYLDVAFDGEKIYISSGNFKGEHIPNLTRFDSGRPTAIFERMLIWDLAGNELESTPISDGKNKRLDDELPWRKGKKNNNPSISYDEYTKTNFEFDGANICIAAPFRYGSRDDQDSEHFVEVELTSEKENWKGYLPYLKYPEKVVEVLLTENILLIGTDFGHVEAIDRTTGQSKWMYIFPTFRRTMSYSSYGMPPMMATAAKTYEEENKHKKPESGFVLVGAKNPSIPNVIFDPNPAPNPYKDLTAYLVIAWICVLIPIFATGCIIWLAKKNSMDARVSAIFAFIVVIISLMLVTNFGRVSISSAIGFRVAILAALITTAVYAVIAIKNKNWVSGWLVLLLTLATGLLIFPAFLRL